MKTQYGIIVNGEIAEDLFYSTSQPCNATKRFFAKYIKETNLQDRKMSLSCEKQMTVVNLETKKCYKYICYAELLKMPRILQFKNKKPFYINYEIKTIRLSMYQME